MHLFSATVIRSEPDIDNSIIIRLKPNETKTIFAFEPGQYCLLQNPFLKNKEDVRPFSVASSPQVTHALEFCIKIQGDWTKAYSRLKIGDEVHLTGPFGTFFWNDAITNAVFLIGGTGISPIMSMLRTMVIKRLNPKVTLLYGNRTPETILYKEELAKIQKDMQNFHLVNIFSEIDEKAELPEHNYQGFITPEIVEKEVDFSGKPIFFVIGPPIFIEKMHVLLANFHIKPDQIMQEDVSLMNSPSPEKES